MTPQQIEALNIAGQCRATASSPLAKNILVDECNGLLTELLLDAARIIEALAQPEQEPVAWADLNALSEQINSVNCGTVYRLPSKEENRQPLYTTPPQRKPLTDEQIMANDVLRYHFALNGGAGPISKKGRKVIDAIEAAHGIKENT